MDGYSAFITIIIFNIIVFSALLYSLYQYNHLNFESLKYFIYATTSFLLTISPYLYFHYLEGNQFNNFRTIIARLSIVTAILGILILSIGIRTISGLSFSILDRVLAFFLILAGGNFIPHLSYTWNGSWKSQINSDIDLYLFLIAVFLFLIRITQAIFIQYKRNYGSNKFQFRSITVGIGITLFGIIIMPFEYMASPSNISLSLVFMIFGISSIVFIYISNPVFFAIDNLGLQYLLISHRENGNPILIYKSPSAQYKHSASLYSGWLKGIQDVFNEITSDSDIRFVNFHDRYLYSYTNETVNAYLFADRFSPLLEDLLRIIADNIRKSEPKLFKYHSSEVSKLELNRILKRQIF